MNPSDLIIPLLLAGAAACGTGRRVNVYAALTRGAEDGLTVLLHVIPALVGLLTAVSMFRASGAMDALARLCAPVLNLLGIPAETVPLMLVRPVSGSGALAVASDLMASHGPDSYIGRVAAVMLGSTETTFYTIAVYFGSAGIVRTRHTVPAALAADLTGFLTAALTVRLLFGLLTFANSRKKARQSRAFFVFFMQIFSPFVQMRPQTFQIPPHERHIRLSPCQLIRRHVVAGVEHRGPRPRRLGDGVRHQMIGKLNIPDSRNPFLPYLVRQKSNGRGGRFRLGGASRKCRVVPQIKFFCESTAVGTDLQTL